VETAGKPVSQKQLNGVKGAGTAVSRINKDKWKNKNAAN
jgi:hypothetical protein